MFKTLKIVAGILGTIGAVSFTVAAIDDRKRQHYLKKKGIEPKRKQGFYEKNIKRPLDCMLATEALILLSPIMGVTSFLVKKKLGSPVLFTQVRPGMIDPETGKEKLFKLYKFRTMSDERDENGKLLSDDVRLTDFGKKLRATSIDELPEMINIIKGDMAVVGPRPLLVQYIERYNEDQRRRHEVRPGLTGLAQVSGRNAVSWEEKFNLDLQYVDNISFAHDCMIIVNTVLAVLKREGISSETSATMEEFMGNINE